MTTTADPGEQTAERRIVFVRLPPVLDFTNDRIVLDTLTAALAGRPSIVVADGARTAYCDSAGVSALVCAHRHAAAVGAELRVVTASAPVLRAVKLIAADSVLDVYLSMDDALADMTGPQERTPCAVPARTSETEQRGHRGAQPDD